MVALLLYSYCRGIFSSRKIMQACEERLTCRVIAGDDIPNWRTISDFRKLNIKELQQLFVQVLQLCQVVVYNVFILFWQSVLLHLISRELRVLY